MTKIFCDIADINLIKKAVLMISQKLSTVLSQDSYQYEALISLCNRIKNVGQSLKVIKNNKPIKETPITANDVEAKGKSLSNSLTELISKIGENIQIVSYKKYFSEKP